MPKIHFLPDDKTVEVAPGTSILEAALANDIFIEHSCGGFCACTTCHVYVNVGFDSLPEMEDIEMDKLDFAENVKMTSRLSCQAKVFQDITVDIPQATTYGGVHMTREERAQHSH
jgi:2Fe-2S ferredoxin